MSETRQFILLIFLSCFFLKVSADVRLPKLISDGMVLQRDIRTPVWGWASGGEKVSIRFQNHTFITTCNKDGKWRINLPAYRAGGPFDMIISGNNKIIIKNILIGDVWICSGQSNMAFKMGAVKDKYPQDIAQAANPNIRQFEVIRNYSLKVLDSLQSNGWKSADEKTVLSFSAVAYFFAVELYAKYKVPVGLINTSVGGSAAEAWISPEALKEFSHYLEEHNRISDIAAERGKQESFTAIAKSENIKPEHFPSNLYNAMLAPLIPYAVKGVIWYQGERNAQEGKSYEYRTLFPALIKDWRSQWGQKKLPFLYVQLPNFKEPVSEPGESAWAELREAQLMALSLPNTGMAVINDIGEANNIHPKNKKDVGLRLALTARKIAYRDRKVVYSGPVFESMRLSGNKITLRFKNTGKGMVVKGGGDLKQFSIAGEDKKFVQAEAKIQGNRVIVWHDNIQSPVAVRYAWADNPEGSNLYNMEGLPASSFRTDDWPGITYPGK